MGNNRRSLIHRQAQAWLILLVATIACSGATELRCSACPTLEVSRVIDGDTFDSPAGRVRLFGVDTPERGQRCFNKATDRLRELAGTTVRLETGTAGSFTTSTPRTAPASALCWLERA